MSNAKDDDLQRQASEHTLGLNPVVGLRRKDLLSTARMVLRQAFKQPIHSIKHVAHLSVELGNVIFGKSALQPTPDDRRFADPAWSQNPLYRRYLQTYLAWRKELHDWIGGSDLTPQDISRAHFVINLMTEAMSPTNSAANPAAVKRFFETGGKSLLDGLSHLAKDLVNNGGMPSQVNMDAFEVGKNLGTTEGAVVFRNDVLELIQYKPITEQVHERPLLVIPPQINKFYVFDLSPEKSLARFCLRSTCRPSSSVGATRPRRNANGGCRPISRRSRKRSMWCWRSPAAKTSTCWVPAPAALPAQRCWATTQPWAKRKSTP
ncbi:Poly-hydroxyalkanoic acid synthase, s II [Pseudomonas amygdali pv. lachrymans]|uniref:Poly-hydroxyalkanoic acid synthase, s II n=1 Tax=Pseudomonas amygdali pv. lachrymans TaxID=53707 RepID=A0AB37R049_PSEAV|nr:PolyR-hydroxyalkanoic acid synthase [Pseudomonas amygdali pv. lachrymans]KPC15387.1 PolyR-hydroxyalkanoic acid synthase [Pseudomonas amygdali pv. lachrymans]RMM34689.1 Poly-hydroxyalkanoic acid synthase, s II [Pseudomonas amygdali pv. lachrymans]RMT15176.1 Poly-hydroxyalkanoic acid synthase, s II [Pseudomonas amygdali pv. lachrymans]RMU16434.1 Poly-hydroxyalkanoic acid synthase, s II [Pseudomonas amygdali pv. lachrymans]